MSSLPISKARLPSPANPLRRAGVSHPAAGARCAPGAGFQPARALRQSCLRPQGPGNRNTLAETHRRGIAHAGTGANLAEAAAPAYLHLPKLTVALVASASGLIAPGGNATAERPGVNELRIDAGGQPNEATADLPGTGVNTPDAEDAQRILANIRTARRQSDLVIVYQHNHVFREPLLRDDLLRGHGGAAGPE